jgi:hypothetical protein
MLLGSAALGALAVGDAPEPVIIFPFIPRPPSGPVAPTTFWGPMQDFRPEREFIDFQSPTGPAVE